MTTVATRRIIVEQEERLDRIARAIYGTESRGTTEALLDANPGLGALGVLVPAGTSLLVPEIVEDASAAAVRPWV